MSLTAVPFVSASAQEIPPPPYLVTRSEGLVIGVAYDESRVKSVAPAGVPVAPGATGTIIMYTAREGYGLPPYSSSWMGLDLEGLDAPGGTKGRWMVSGLYGPRPVATALAEYFNYPTREGSTRVEREGGRVVAVGTLGGAEMIRAELNLKPEPCRRVSGFVHDVTRKGGTGSLQLIKVPYVGELCTADSAKVDIIAPASDPFSQLKPVKVLWAVYWIDAAWGWSLAP